MNRISRNTIFFNIRMWGSALLALTLLLTIYPHFAAAQTNDTGKSYVSTGMTPHIIR